MGFKQLIDTPTHRDGGIIDHLYIYQPEETMGVLINSSIFTPLYSDHAAISVVINKGTNEFIRMPSTAPDDVTNDPNEKTAEDQAATTSRGSKGKSSAKQPCKYKR